MATTMSEKLAKSAEKGEIYAFVAGEPDNAGVNAGSGGGGVNGQK